MQLRETFFIEIDSFPDYGASNMVRKDNGRTPIVINECLCSFLVAIFSLGVKQDYLAGLLIFHGL